MKRRRSLLGALGVVALGVGVTIAGDGPVAATVGGVVAVLGSDYLLLAAIAAVAVVAAAVMLFSGRTGNLQQRSMPAPEGSTSAPMPGDGFDDRVSSLWFALPLVGRRYRRRVRARLRTAAIDAVCYSDQCTHAVAERRVETGSWTDDPAAVAFLAGEPAGSLTAHAAAIADGETLERRRARRVVDEIAARAEPRGARR